MMDRMIVDEALRSWKDPYLGQDLLTAKMIGAVDIEPDRVAVRVELGYPLGEGKVELEARLTEHLEARLGGVPVTVKVDFKILSHSVQKNLKPLQGIRNILAIPLAKAASVSRRPPSSWPPPLPEREPG